MSQSVNNYNIQNGFALAYRCDSCGFYIDTPYFWNSFVYLKSNENTCNSFCPVCGSPVTSDLSGLKRPFHNCAFILQFPLDKFIPAHVSGCNLWLDASLPRTVSLSGSVVTNWADRSPYLIDFSSKIGSVYYVDNYLSFNGSSHLSHDVGDDLHFLSTGNSSVFFVINMPATMYNGILFGNQYGSSYSTYLFGFYLGVLNEYIFNTPPFTLNYYSRHSNQSLIPFGNSVLVSQLFNSSVSVGNSCLFTYRNGSLHYTADLLASVFSSASSASFAIGSLYGGYGAWQWLGNLYEVIFYNRLVSDLERQQIENYLIKKWSINV